MICWWRCKRLPVESRACLEYSGKLFFCVAPNNSEMELFFIIILIRNFVKGLSGYNSKKETMEGHVKTRKKSYGDCNIVGRNVERLRKQRGIKQKDFVAKIQVMGCDMNPTSYSKLEGQLRIATDREIYEISRVLDVPIEALFDTQEEE